MPDTAFFQPELFDFLRQLKRHNNRDWFAKNKQRYEEVVRDPALMFIASFGPHLHKLSPHFVADPRPSRGSLFRIYRDTRFSADKRPFKTHVGIHFSHASGKDAHAPVFYLHLEPENPFAAAGVWHPDNSALTKIRTAIVAEPEQWAKVRRKAGAGGRQPEAPTARVRPKSPVHQGPQAEGLRGIGRAHRGAGVWPQFYARVCCGMQVYAAAGRVHDEGAGVGGLGGVDGQRHALSQRHFQALGRGN